jgi:hypothetical protein
LWYYTAWKNLLLYDAGKVSWSLEEQNKVLWRFNGFFTPVGSALREAALMQFAKVFDPDARAVSLWNLLRAAREDMSLVSGRTSAEVDEERRRLRQSKKMITGLMRTRDQRLAHEDANPAPPDPLLVKDLDRLVEDVQSAFNWLSTAHDGNVVIWEYSVEKVGAHTSQVIAILLEELSRRDAIAEDSRS